MIVRRQASIEKVNGKQVVLALESGERLTVGREELEPTVEVGTAFVVQILPAAEAALDQQALARTLLNQILADEKED